MALRQRSLSAQPHMIRSLSHVHDLPTLTPQVLLGWKYGDCLDEKAKMHPQLRTYKSLTEKVPNAES